MFNNDDLNPMERIILKRVTKYMVDNGVKYVGIYVDNEGKPGFEVFTEPVKVLTQTQAKELINQLQKQKEISNGELTQNVNGGDELS